MSTDYMFRPFSITPSSGVARGTIEEKLTMLQSIYNTYCPKAMGKNEIPKLQTRSRSYP